MRILHGGGGLLDSGLVGTAGAADVASRTSLASSISLANGLWVNAPVMVPGIGGFFGAIRFAV
jgi:hypothetical protein